jgi:hypothetical protein
MAIKFTASHRRLPRQAQLTLVTHAPVVTVTPAIVVPIPPKPFVHISTAVERIAFRNRLYPKVARLHSLGSRAVAEFIAELGLRLDDPEEAFRRLERYLALYPEILDVTGGDRFPPFTPYEIPKDES